MKPLSLLIYIIYNFFAVDFFDLSVLDGGVNIGARICVGIRAVFLISCNDCMADGDVGWVCEDIDAEAAELLFMGF